MCFSSDFRNRTWIKLKTNDGGMPADGKALPLPLSRRTRIFVLYMLSGENGPNMETPDPVIATAKKKLTDKSRKPVKDEEKSPQETGRKQMGSVHSERVFPHSCPFKGWPSKHGSRNVQYSKQLRFHICHNMDSIHVYSSMSCEYIHIVSNVYKLFRSDTV